MAACKFAEQYPVTLPDCCSLAAYGVGKTPLAVGIIKD